MSETGIVRRMDELGRIVIPKEIRRTMRLEEGDEMEIFPDGERLVVRKHSRFSGFLRAAEKAVALAASATGCDVFLAAADSIAAAGGAHRRELVSRPLTERFAALARSRETGVLKSEGGFSPAEGVSVTGGCLVAVPVSAAGDVTGCLFCAGDDAEKHKEFMEFGAGVLGAVCGG